MARNGVLFLLVFYLQGVRGEDPVTAGIELAPLAVGLLVLSPISGILADRYGSRVLATLGMLVTAVGWPASDDQRWTRRTGSWRVAAVIGAGRGLFNSPNTSAVMGVVPPAKRGIGAGARMMLTQTGFVISIALAIGLVTSVHGPAGDARGLLGYPARRATASTSARSSTRSTSPSAAGAVASLIGAGVSAMRGKHVVDEAVPEEPATEAVTA